MLYVNARNGAGVVPLAHAVDRSRAFVMPGLERLPVPEEKMAPFSIVSEAVN